MGLTEVGASVSHLGQGKGAIWAIAVHRDRTVLKGLEFRKMLRVTGFVVHTLGSRFYVPHPFILPPRQTFAR